MSLSRILAAALGALLLATCLMSSLPARAAEGSEATVQKAAPAKAEATDAKQTKQAAAKPEKAKAEKPKPKEAKPDKPQAEKPKMAKPEKAQAEKSKPKETAPKKKPSFLSKLMKSALAEPAAKPAKEKGPAKDAKKPVPKKTATAAKSKVKPKPTTAKVVKLTITGEYPEELSFSGLFAEMRPTLASLVEKLDKVAEDKDVAAVVLEIDGAHLGRGKINEIRQAIARVRKSGKPVYAVLSSADAREYFLACACDEILMAPSGMLLIPGVRAEVMFFKGLLDKIGVEAEVLQIGKYKGAGEPYTRTSMSPDLRESFDALVDNLYERFVAGVAKDRKMEDYKVKTLVDQGLFTAEDAKKQGLVDQVIYLDEFVKKLKKTLKVDEIKLVTKYKQRRRSHDFSGVGGMVNFVEMMLGGKPGGPENKDKKVAVIYAVGPIMQGKSESGMFRGRTLGSATMVKALETADRDPTVVAIVLRVDSPGGSAVASDLIWHETVRIKKPVIASMGDVAASGGYYISVGADTIFAEPGTLTGSIGVIGGKLVLGKLYDKVGLSTEVISRGKNSGLLSADKPFTSGERAAWLASMKEVYRQFVAKSARGRKMPYGKLEKLAQGRVYTGDMAVANGLVDRLGTLHDAVAEAKKAAGLKSDEKVELLILPRPKSIFEQLFGDPDASIESALALTGLADPLLELNLLRRLFTEPALTLMPYRVDLK